MTVAETPDLRLAALEAAIARVEAEIAAHRDVHRLDGVAITRAYKELQRRLKVLNHAHADALAKEAAFLPRDMYEARHDELAGIVSRSHNELNGRLERLERTVSETHGRDLGVEVAASRSDRAQRLIFALIAVIISVVVVSVSLYFGFRNRPPDTLRNAPTAPTVPMTTGR